MEAAWRALANLGRQRPVMMRAVGHHLGTTPKTSLSSSLLSDFTRPLTSSSAPFPRVMDHFDEDEQEELDLTPKEQRCVVG